jgi:hypothetical protein
MIATSPPASAINAATELASTEDRRSASLDTANQEVPRGLDWAQKYEDYVAGLRECARAAEDGGSRYSLELYLFE